MFTSRIWMLKTKSKARRSTAPPAISIIVKRNILRCPKQPAFCAILKIPHLQKAGANARCAISSRKNRSRRRVRAVPGTGRRCRCHCPRGVKGRNSGSDPCGSAPWSPHPPRRRAEEKRPRRYSAGPAHRCPPA
jgi:hypothetical protein